MPSSIERHKDGREMRTIIRSAVFRGRRFFEGEPCFRMARSGKTKMMTKDPRKWPGRIGTYLSCAFTPTEMSVVTSGAE